jgi:uncharacterized protein DUF4190
MAQDSVQEIAERLGLDPSDPAVLSSLERLSARPTEAPSREQHWGMKRELGVPANRVAIFALFCAFVVPVLGIVFGYVALDEIRASNGAERGESMATWAMIIGTFWLICIIVFAVWFATRHS